MGGVGRSGVAEGRPGVATDLGFRNRVRVDPDLGFVELVNDRVRWHRGDENAGVIPAGASSLCGVAFRYLSGRRPVEAVPRGGRCPAVHGEGGVGREPGRFPGVSP